MSKTKESDRELYSIANSFLVDIIYAAMKEFNIDFNTLYDIFKQINFIDIINDTETMVVGAHHGVDDVLQRIRKVIQ